MGSNSSSTPSGTAPSRSSLLRRQTEGVHDRTMGGVHVQGASDYEHAGARAIKMDTDPIPNSSQLAFPTISAPLSERKETTVASNGDRNPCNILEEHVVGQDFVQMLSLTASRSPVNAPCWDRLCVVVACS